MSLDAFWNLKVYKIRNYENIYLIIFYVSWSFVYLRQKWFVNAGLLNRPELSVLSVFRSQVFIEQKALDTVAHLCDGDARAALNGLQLAVQACVVQVRVASSEPDAGPRRIIVREQHIKEGLQRSHILYDKAGVSCLHSSHRPVISSFRVVRLLRLICNKRCPILWNAEYKSGH